MGEFASTLLLLLPLSYLFLLFSSFFSVQTAKFLESVSFRIPAIRREKSLRNKRIAVLGIYFRAKLAHIAKPFLRLCSKFRRSLKNELIPPIVYFLGCTAAQTGAHFQFSLVYLGYKKNSVKGENVMEQLAHNMIIIFFSSLAISLPILLNPRILSFPVQFWVSLWKRR